MKAQRKPYSKKFNEENPKRTSLKEACISKWAPRVMQKMPEYSPQYEVEAPKYTPQDKEEEPHYTPQLEDKELNAASTIFHDFCFNMAKNLVAVVVSVEYRLAPEHRLPAAYEDAVEALHWIKTNQSDDWLKNHVDYSNVFLMGSSAGGNIAYNAGLRVAMVEDELSKMIKGLILVQPFFSGTHRTRSEIKLANDSHLLLCNNDMLWELSLPVGVDRDHGYCNPMIIDNVVRLKKIREFEWWVLVTDCDGDPLVDRSIGLVRLMEENGVNVVGHFTKGGYHGVQDREPLKANELFVVIKKFISSLPDHAME
ncbi:hypothetical protein KIW84_013102 [Lathyrus oleraceus]|uniref:Alpha/beta hydrolase fold-3 domain-containing protein n=1 Tax=Pisum sativum TaxID=3888 RepID=A0A9D5BJ90_PEA|nr:hypothetical protein KIW84_013102 [Pisum sativum]